MCSVECVTSTDPLQRGLRPPLLHRVTTRRLQSIDYVIAALLLVLTGIHLYKAQLPRGSGDFVLVTALSLAAALAIALRRRAPMFALGLLAISTAIVVITGQAFFAEPLIAFPMFQVGSNYERRKSLPALAAVCLLILVSMAVHLLWNTNGNTSSLAILASIAAWFVGDSVRVRRTYVAGLAEQAAQRQREIIERAQRSVAEERLQIARELHDVVAHSLSVIAVQSGVGRHVIDEHPGQAKKALAAVEETSRTALVELRRMLGILRHDDGRPAPLAPVPGVGELDQLIEQVRTAGIVVALDVNSTVAKKLSPTADLAIYRIVQEALTNVVKHAASASVNVELRDEPDALVLEILDDGGAGLPKYPQLVDDESAHHGLVGMRERVALFEGSFDAGRRPEGGFRVLARFPLAYLGAS
jgi:signal transduction histidine kinase